MHSTSPHSMYLAPPASAHMYAPPSLSTSGAAAVGWKSSIVSQIAARNQSQSRAYADIFTAYARMLAQCRQLKTRTFQLEQEVMTTRQLSSLSATPGGPPGILGGGGSAGGKDGAGGVGFNGAAQKALEDKILKLQEDLTAAYRLQSENSHTSLRLKEQAEKDERALLKKEEELAEKTRAVITLQATLAQEKEGAKQRHKHLEHTVDLLRAEVQSSRSLAKAHEAKIAALSEENDKLLSTILRMREEQAGNDSEMNQIREELQRATIVAQAAAEAKKLAEEGRAIAPTEVDLSDTNAVIEHVAWATNFKVEIPQDRKRTIRGHRGPVSCVRYNSAGTLFASAGLDGLVKVYDARSGGNRASLRGSKEGIMNCTFSSNDELLLASGNDSISRVWSLRTSRVVHTLVGHSAKVWAGAFTLDGEKVITGSHDRTIKIWDMQAAAGSCQRSVLCQSSCNFLSLSSNDNLIGSAHLDTHVRFWSVKTGELMKDLSDIHDGQVTSVEFSKDGTLVATASRDNTVKVTDMRTYRVLHELQGSSRVPYRNLINWSRAVFSPDDKHLLAGGHAGELFFWNVESGKLEAILAGVNLGDHAMYGGAPSPSASSPASSSAAAVAAANAISEQAISCVDWNRNGRQVMSCDHGGNIHVWENEIKTKA